MNLPLNKILDQAKFVVRETKKRGKLNAKNVDGPKLN
jgi:hypothetical protein